VKCDPFVARLGAERRQLFPRRQLPADFPSRQLEHHRPERLAGGLEVLGRRQPLARSEQVRVQPMQVRVTPLLVHIEVTLGVECDSPIPAPLTVNPQRDLLRHGSRRHPHCRLLAEQLGDASLEPFRQRALTIEVDLVVRRGPLGEST
jgi:hypothetical protein